MIRESCQRLMAWASTQGSWRNRASGQGLVEYAGALCIAGLLVGAVVLGTQSGGWMFNAYSAIVTAASNMLVAMAGQIGA